MENEDIFMFLIRIAKKLLSLSHINLKPKEMKKFELMALPYAVDALEPVISRQTLEFHHGKHLTRYVNNLNGLRSGR